MWWGNTERTRENNTDAEDKENLKESEHQRGKAQKHLNLIIKKIGKKSEFGL